MGNNIIEIKDLSKKYGDFLALDNINLDLPRGKIIGLLGPNGSGKTTLIKLIAGLLNQYDGKIIIDEDKEPGYLSKAVVAYLPDRDCLDPNWNFRDAVDFFNDFFEDFDPNKAYRLVNELKLPYDRKFKELSKGTKEKMQLILIMSRKAKLFLFDEPIAGVDPVARDVVFKLITENKEDDASILVSTHLVLDIESYLDYVVFIQNGQITLKNDVQKLKEASGKTLNEIFKEVYIYEQTY